MSTPPPLTYRDAGVDIDAGDQLVENIKPFAKRTMRPEVLAGIGGFGGLVEISKRYLNPVLVSGTDGVGTKLKLAFHLNKHDTVGIDLVAMSVNDILVQGAEPLFFLDYLATGRLDPDVAALIVGGMGRACEANGCALIGGETAEMPGFYGNGEYDIAGFGVGVVEKSKILDGTKARAGDALVAIASSGLHSNGYSLARRVLLGKDKKSAKKALARWVPAFSGTMGDILLTPTRIYVKLALNLVRETDIRGLSHITGGGLAGNLPRVFPESLAARVDTRTWPIPEVFEMIAIAGNVPREEMFRTFNMGVGLVVICPPKDVRRVVEIAHAHGDRAWRCGELVERRSGMKDCELV